jgi:hypothetical protein
MDALAVMRVTVVVVGVMHLLRWAGVPERWAPLLVAVLSSLAVVLWAVSQGVTGAEGWFGYLSGWVAVATSAATVWGFTWATRCESRGIRRRRARRPPAR